MQLFEEGKSEASQAPSQTALHGQVSHMGFPHSHPSFPTRGGGGGGKHERLRERETSDARVFTEEAGPYLARVYGNQGARELSSGWKTALTLKVFFPHMKLRCKRIN